MVTMMIGGKEIGIANNAYCVSEIAKELLPGYDSKIMFDSLKNLYYIDESLLEKYSENPDKYTVPLSDYHIVKIASILNEFLASHGHKVSFTKNIIYEWIQIVGYESGNFDSWKDKMEHIEWDGVPRMRRWFMDLIGARCYALTREEESKYIESVTEAWFISVVARQYGPFKAEVIPILLGDQGIGKTRLCEYTAGDNEFYTSSCTDVSNRQKYVEGTTGKTVIEWAEATQLKTKDVEELKAHISEKYDQYRMPYAHTVSLLRRRGVPIMTSNNAMLFTDVTGNRRFFPITCTTPFGDGDPYARAQVWAEAIELYKELCITQDIAVKESYPLSQEVQELATRVQADRTYGDDGVGMIEDYLSTYGVNANDFGRVGCTITMREIATFVFGMFEQSYLTKDDRNKINSWYNRNQKNWIYHKAKRIDNVLKRDVFERVKEDDGI